MKAGVEYIYLLLVVGYYIYKAVAGNKSKQAPEVDAESTAPPKKKKKSFLEEILEQMEQQNNPQPKPVEAVPSYETPRELRDVEQTQRREQRARQERREDASNPYAQRPAAAATATANRPATAQQKPRSEIRRMETEPNLVAAKKSRIRLGSTVLSPKDAVVAQILFERKF